ncbi:hypothetical protein SDJN03_03075, partial [Cucurbita argyrosperma subsp. sororia]
MWKWNYIGYFFESPDRHFTLNPNTRIGCHNILEALIMLYRTHKRLHIICQDHATVCRQMGELNKERALSDDSLSGGEMKVYVCAMAFALLAVTAFELDACKYVICN